MFHLTDRSRRRICLAAFFLLCVTPTIVVLACGVSRHLPGHARAEADRLGRNLGQNVSINRVRHPKPNSIRYEGLALSDPETGRPLGRCKALDVSRSSSVNEDGKRRSLVELRFVEPEIETAELRQVWRLVERVISRRAGWSQPEVRLTAEKLTLRSGKMFQALTEVQGKIETLSKKTRAETSFRYAGNRITEPVSLRVTRDCRTNPSTTGWDVYTGDATLACSVLAMGLPAMDALGPRSRFCGHLGISTTSRGLHVDLAGQFTELDLERLVTGNFPHTLTGTATLTLDQARFSGGRLEEAVGRISAGPGTIGPSLLDAASRLGFTRRLESPPATWPVPYETLAARFRIDSSGFCLLGGYSRAILVDSLGALMVEPASQPLPFVQVIKALVPDAEVQVPATRQTDWLLRHLPVEDAGELESS